MDIDYQRLGMKIRETRVDLKMSQEELAEKANLSVSFLGHIERGTRKMSLETLVSLETVLGISMDQLFYDQLPLTENALPIIFHAISQKPPQQVARFVAAVCALAKGIDQL